MDIRESFWHKTLKRPYGLKVIIDQGVGRPIVFLHGLGGKSADWRPVTDQIDLSKNRVIALDLLGFGKSPKPGWVEYWVDDHAKAIIKTLRKHGIKRPYILVGHSMGAVVAARVARRKPKQVSQLILYEIPVYVDLPEQNVRDIRHRAYLSFFSNALKHPERTMKLLSFLGRIASDFVSISLDARSWPPFERSLTNTVMQNTVYEDLGSIKTPTDVIYGRYDMVVFKRVMKKMFISSPHITFHQLNEAHRITSRTGKLINKLLP